MGFLRKPLLIIFISARQCANTNKKLVEVSAWGVYSILYDYKTSEFKYSHKSLGDNECPGQTKIASTGEVIAQVHQVGLNNHQIKE